MCSPFAMLGASTALQLVGAKQGAEYSEEYAEKAAAGAEANALRQYTALQDRQIEQNARATQAIQQNARAAREATSAASVSAGESGVSGNSVAALIGDFERTSLNYESAVTRNQAFLDHQFNRDAEAVRLGQEAETNRAYAQIQTPNYLGILLGTASSALSLGNEQKNIAPRTGNDGP